ncbi:FlaA1/EpsC-like NDP-sugar epimerase [Thalassospira sp. MBR-102]|uniref:Nucleotide sugar dehydratase n=1 Tax=Thalassospira xiamenensis TaxID=220697 RepID=A0ABR5Y8J1_9PROT|nr:MULTISPECIES: nucleoside-diphosphate sugar epimerase/dehydratase [Thalassospira]KZD06646.1 nucleotide sugar dehydratase [Thalassospira xiamenensis]KZD10755.1 nucleotide sugar dehydratase [Thalassospira xiamenensis]MAB32441.1 polysaccharide biosynthesis protein [Thalassospira sp.]MBL4843002.1 polysaccharide biosynthesis protein [Thalassospira sp.]MCD1592653.1 polysaccharide biosynthesis protein [Thalassospira xiamenensis]|tara:strand:+ start:453 stop:2411 length:1959 start_codon:yes stop_codon:yes gene_type:complete
MSRLFQRSQIAFVHDVTMAAVSLPAALYLRVGDGVVFYNPQNILFSASVFTVIAAVSFWFFGLYRGIWRYASLNDLTRIAKAVTVAIGVLFLVLFLTARLDWLPRSTPIIQWFLLMALLGGSRLIYRITKDKTSAREMLRQGTHRLPVLLIGAGDEAEAFIRETRRSANTPFDVVGIVSLTDSRVGRNMHGVDVLATVDRLEEILGKLANSKRGLPRRLVLTGDALRHEDITKWVEIAEQRGITLARLPKLNDLREGLADPLQIRPVAIEDLLGRPQARLDRDKVRQMIAGHRVLVTGAGGSIGSELVRQIAAYGPESLTLLDAGEYNLYAIDMEMAEKYPDLPRESILGDVRDRTRIDQVFAKQKPEIVFHAAAYKHVPLVEHNPNEGILTNTLGTRNVAEACRAAGVGTMVLISTDKAVNPANVMGASKRLAECYCQALETLPADQRGPTRFVTVRFGNVLGSTGSVVPLFRRQLEAGGPLTVTHEGITRYFMTIAEAVELVLQAAELGKHGVTDGGKIFVLDMGRPVKIIDLARQMILLSGLRPGKDIDIKVTGLRPGEKLYEELFHDGEPPEPTETDGVMLAAPRVVDYALIKQVFDELGESAARRDTHKTLELMGRLVPEFQPPEIGVKSFFADSDPGKLDQAVSGQ